MMNCYDYELIFPTKGNAFGMASNLTSIHELFINEALLPVATTHLSVFNKLQTKPSCRRH
jgi:hypothetical protein